MLDDVFVGDVLAAEFIPALQPVIDLLPPTPLVEALRGGRRTATVWR